MALGCRELTDAPLSCAAFHAQPAGNEDRFRLSQIFESTSVVMYCGTKFTTEKRHEDIHLCCRSGMPVFLL